VAIVSPRRDSIAMSPSCALTIWRAAGRPEAGALADTTGHEEPAEDLIADLGGDARVAIE
jgi:hypothetical protein